MDYTPTVGKKIALKEGIFTIVSVLPKGHNHCLSVVRDNGTKKYFVAVNEDGHQTGKIVKLA